MTFGPVFVCRIHKQKETPRILHALLNIKKNSSLSYYVWIITKNIVKICREGLLHSYKIYV